MGQAFCQADARQPREIKLRRQQNLSVKLRQGISKRTGSASSFLISVSAKFGSANIGDGNERDPKTRDNSLTGPLRLRRHRRREIFLTHSAQLCWVDQRRISKEICRRRRYEILFRQRYFPTFLPSPLFRRISSPRTLFNCPNKCHWRP